jgi:hypothetical protein
MEKALISEAWKKSSTNAVLRGSCKQVSTIFIMLYDPLFLSDVRVVSSKSADLSNRWS